MMICCFVGLCSYVMCHTTLPLWSEVSDLLCLHGRYELKDEAKKADFQNLLEAPVLPDPGDFPGHADAVDAEGELQSMCASSALPPCYQPMLIFGEKCQGRPSLEFLGLMAPRMELWAPCGRLQFAHR